MPFFKTRLPGPGHCKAAVLVVAAIMIRTPARPFLYLTIYGDAHRITSWLSFVAGASVGLAVSLARTRHLFQVRSSGSSGFTSLAGPAPRCVPALFARGLGVHRGQLEHLGLHGFPDVRPFFA
jgi:hypothetical protein